MLILSSLSLFRKERRQSWLGVTCVCDTPELAETVPPKVFQLSQSYSRPLVLVVTAVFSSMWRGRRSKGMWDRISHYVLKNFLHNVFFCIFFQPKRLSSVLDRKKVSRAIMASVYLFIILRLTALNMFQKCFTIFGSLRFLIK